MYDFITHTWNPIKGRCKHNCTYCYMKRWGKQKSIHLDEREMKTDLGNGNIIFIGSSCDLFANDVPEESILRVLNKSKEHQDNKYLFQTRNLIRIKKFLFPIDTFICTTLETNRSYLADSYSSAPALLSRAEELRECLIKRRLVTIEPIMDFDVSEFINMIEAIKPIQVNIGADSGNNHLPEPSREKVLELIRELKKFTIVHTKQNLNRIIV
jgi:protein gp37